MFLQRFLSGVALLVLMIGMIVVGGVWYVLGVVVALCLGGFEFTQIFALKGHRAFGGLMALWIALISLDQVFPWLGLLNPGLTLLLLITLGWAVIRFRQGTLDAAVGFAITVAMGFYLGWVGAHFIRLRALDEGVYWTLTVCTAVWASDTVAYLVGTTMGRTRLIPDISPGKTWEGYLGGIVGASLITASITLLWQQLGASSAISPKHGLALGLIISMVSPLGDIGISIFKRYAGVKNSSNLIPGHGGVLDRLDALLVAGLLGYYYLAFFVL
jgi:phosphatidate cytidylyltransferase